MAGLQFKLYQPLWSLTRAELLADLGRAEDALASIAEDLNVISATGEHWGDAELHRFRGELHASLSEESDAEAAFTTALAVAREQGAKWWELRAATSLARLWSEQDRHAEAHELLSGIYGWFTEGFNTTDLVAARQLLDQMNGKAPRPVTAAA